MATYRPTGWAAPLTGLQPDSAIVDAQYAKGKIFRAILLSNRIRGRAKAKIQAANDFKALKRNLKTLPKSLSKEVGYGGFTFSQAVRVAAWSRQGLTIPGLSKTDSKALNAIIDNDAKAKEVEVLKV